MILVTGATGFLGQRVYAALDPARGRTRALVRDVEKHRSLFPGASKPIATDLLRLRRGDLVSEQVTHVVHLASAVWPVDRGALDRYAAVNEEGTRCLLGALSSSRLRGIVLASTLAVHGTLRGIVDEETRILPGGPYARSKHSQESLVAEFGKRHGIPVAILRFSSIYGAAQFDGTVLPRFVERALSRQPLVLDGARGRVQDFLYVEDAAQATLDALRLEADGIFCIASGTSTTMRSLGEAVIHATGSATRISDKETDPQAPHFRVDTAKAARELRWSPRYDLESGLRAMLEARGRSAPTPPSSPDHADDT